MFCPRCKAEYREGFTRCSEAAGIDSEIKSYDAGKLSPRVGLAGGIELLVRSEDAADADKILSAEAGHVEQGNE